MKQYTVETYKNGTKTNEQTFDDLNDAIDTAEEEMEKVEPDKNVLLTSGKEIIAKLIFVNGRLQRLFPEK